MAVVDEGAFKSDMSCQILLSSMPAGCRGDL